MARRDNRDHYDAEVFCACRCATHGRRAAHRTASRLVTARWSRFQWHGWKRPATPAQGELGSAVRGDHRYVRRAVFARGGYHATGIAELCAANDLGKGALYHYIGSKEELLAAIHDRVMDEVLLGADRVADAGGTPSAQLTMLGNELLDVIHRYPDHVWVFLHEFPALTGERGREVPGAPHAYEQRVEAVLQAGVDSGEFRQLEPRLTALAWLGMHNYTYLWLKPGRRLSARAVARPFAEIFMHGIVDPAAERPAWGAAPSRRRVAAVDDERRAGGPAGALTGQVRVSPDEVAGRAPARGDAFGPRRRARPTAGRRGWPSGTCRGRRS